MSATAAEPQATIVDVDGDFAWVSARLYSSRQDAVAFAMREWPDAPRRDVLEELEWMVLRELDPDDDNDRYLVEEFDHTHAWYPAAAGDGEPYWAVRLYG